MTQLLKLNPARLSREHRLLAILIFIATAVYATYSILRHMHFGSSGYDLGIFDQAVWHMSRFEAPASTTRNIPNILGDHFYPILFLLAPLYWIYSSPVTLLIAQAALIASSLIPIFLFIRKRLDFTPTYLLLISYSLFWGIQSALSFDFHEVAFAVPLIAWAIYAIDSKKWWQYAVCIVLLLLTKENLSFLVVFFGIYLAFQKQYRIAVATAVSGVAWFVLATKVVIPHFAGPGVDYFHWSYSQFGPDALSALQTALASPIFTITTLLTPTVKLATGFFTLLPFLFLPLASPLIVLAIPLIAERFLSTNPAYWSHGFHYSLALAPILVMAMADSLKRLPLQKFHLHLAVATVVVACLILPSRSLWALTSPSFYTKSESDKIGYQALSLIPANASVTAQNGIIPHLSQRQHIYVLSNHAPATDFIIAKSGMGPWPHTEWETIEAYLTTRQTEGCTKVFAQEDWLVFDCRSN